MKKSDDRTINMILAYAAAIAALGASVGAMPEQAQAASPAGEPQGASQAKIERRQGVGATQMKYKAEQLKWRKAKGAGSAARPGAKDPGPSQTPGRGTKLNPQPEPPKPAFGAPGELVPAVKR